eukprot:gene12100-13350_t
MVALNLTNVTLVNNSTNGTFTHAQEKPLSTFSMIRIIIYIIAFIISVLGNGSVLLVTLKRYCSKERISAFKLLLTHLAFVDLLFAFNAFILIPNEIHSEEANDAVPLCAFKKYFRQTPFMAAIGTITIIAIERYLGITSSISRKWTHKRVFISLFIVWTFAFLIYIPNVYVIKVRSSGKNCYEDWGLTSRRVFAVFLALAEYIIPLSIIAFCNFKIVKVIRSRSKNMQGLANSHLSDQQIKDQKKSARILIAVVLGFAILCLPNQILFLYMELANKFNTFDTTYDVLQMFGVILLLHTGFNPIVYSILDEKFRADTKSICCCCCYCCGMKREEGKTQADVSSSTSTRSTRQSGVGDPNATVMKEVKEVK